MASLEVSDVWKETYVTEGYWVGRCALLEVSEGKTVLLIKKYNALIDRAFFMSIPQQSVQNVTASLSSQPRSRSMTECVSSIQHLTSSVMFFKLKSCSLLC